DLQRSAAEIGIAHSTDGNDSRDSGRQNRIRLLWDRPRRIAKELQDKNDGEPREDREPPKRSKGETECDRDRDREKRPAYASDDGMRIIFGHRRALAKLRAGF